MGLSSGRGFDAALPPELKTWHWGAFVLTWLWGLFNKTYIGALLFVGFLLLIMVFQLLTHYFPVFNQPLYYQLGGAILFIYFIAIHVYHGIYGKRWAWQNKKWPDLQTFRRVQQRWSFAGGALIIGGAIALAASLYFNRSEKVFDVAVKQVQEHAAIQKMIGTPMEVDKKTIKVSYDTTDSGRFIQYRFMMQGSKDKAEVFFLAINRHGQWQIISQAVFVKSRNKLFVLTDSKKLPPR